MINCWFKQDPTVQLCCLFYVFEFLISPVIMGMAFLESTQTLTKHQYRLQPRSANLTDVWQLCSIDYPRRRLYCLADDKPEFATADTGSEIDLISSAYAKERGFHITEVDLETSVVQLADGSLSQLQGKVVVSIVLGNSESQPHVRDFYILDGLTSDILLGEDFLDQVSAFTTYKNAFALDDEDDGTGEVNTIIWFNTFEFNVFHHFGGGRSAAPRAEDNGKHSPSPIVTFTTLKFFANTLLIIRNVDQREKGKLAWIKNKIDQRRARKGRLLVTQHYKLRLCPGTIICG